MLDGTAVEGVDAPEHPAADRGPVDPVQRCVHPNPEPLGVADGSCRVGGHDEHLRRDTAAVQTRPAETTGVDDRGPEVVEFGTQQHVAAPRAEDDQVVGLRDAPSHGHGAPE